jgi:general secretion pathway protein A
MMITLDELFAAGEVTTDRTAALVQLFGLWQRDYDTLEGHDACAKARQGDLRCLRGKGSVAALAALNRPALLHLKPPSGRSLPAVLTALDGTWMTLKVGEHLVRASTKEIAAAWTGEYLLLWDPPAGYRRAVRRGSEGATVAWLKNRLAALAGEPAQAAVEATFDAALEARVIALQHSRRLLEDGIVGPRTLIHLNNALGAQDVAILTAQP